MLVYHLIPGVMPGGYVGVDVFFVLSGFLITSLLVSRISRDGTVNLTRFWVRRFRRLTPAVVLVTFTVAGAALIVGGDALVALPRQVLGSVSATYNWLEIGAGSSYFDKSSPLLLTNMWSLALEQQFYLVWPLIVLLVARRGTFTRVAVALTIGTASTLWHIHLLGDDVSRSYMGTDTHLWGLMMGAALAFALPHAMDRHQGRARLAHLSGLAGWLGLVGVVAIAMTEPIPMYPWGMVAAAGCALLTIRAVVGDVSQVGPGQVLARFLDSPVLTWLGERSYGIYLWHWPLIVLLFYTNPSLNVYLSAVLITLASVGAAALSYRYVETPIRTEGIRGWWSRVKAKFGRAPIVSRAGIAITPVLVVTCALWAMAIAPATSSGEQAVRQGGEGRVVVGGAEGDDSSAPDPASPGPTPSPAPAEPELPDPGPTEKPEAPVLQPGDPVPTSAVPGENITVIGDSLTLASVHRLEQYLPGVYVDAAESRAIKTAPDLIAELSARGQLRDYVVIALSSNALITPSDTERILDLIGPDRTLVYVTGYGPPRATWIGQANAEIRRAASAYPNVAVADWHAAIEKHADLLAGDHVHPTTVVGLDLYVATIVEAINSTR